jgi:hypothetical protein
VTGVGLIIDLIQAKKKGPQLRKIQMRAEYPNQLDYNGNGFLWAGSDKVSGAQCLVAWEKVCTERRDGGLGVKRLDTQNSCLLLKLIHRLHHPAQSSWAQWAGQRVSLADLQGEVWGEHWTALRSLLPAYQAFTTADVGNRHSTSF